MNFELTEEQRIFQESVRAFARRYLQDGALKRAHQSAFPRDVARMMGEQGLLGITISEADGGIGGTLMDAVIAIEEVALVCPRSADVVQAGNFGPLRTIAEFASSEVKQKYLPRAIAGDLIVSLGMSEPEAGSAVTDLKTTASEDGDGVRLNGTKVFGTHSSEADVYLVYCRFGPGVGGIGSVLVERGAEGFETGKPTRFLGGEDWSQLYFEDCYVPAEQVVLPAGGFKKQMSGFNAERVGNTARSLAVGRHAYNIALEHARTRKQFGRRLCEFQGIQWKFAEMAMKLEAAQLLLYRAAVNADSGLPSPFETSVAKATCNIAGFEVANEAMQIMGGMGYSEECLVEYCLRRTRGWMIAGGSVEIMKNRIAESVFGERFSQRPKA